MLWRSTTQRAALICGLGLLSALSSPAAAQHEIGDNFGVSERSQDGEARRDPMRVLVVGDSMTHCDPGDYTWRWRLLEWFEAQGIAFEYVGPYSGTLGIPDATPPIAPLPYGTSAPKEEPNFNGSYADGIDSDGRLNHFAVIGRATKTDVPLIEQVVRDHPADLMLVDMGFNDLGWFYSDDVELVNNTWTFIQNTRRASPNMKFVLATIVHRTFLGGRQDLVRMTDSFNRAMKSKVSEWSTPGSPVTWAPVREEYECGPQYGIKGCPAAWDGLHPNELGEYQIARGFSRALVSALGIGKAPLEVPKDIPRRPLPPPSNFQVASSAYGVTATWNEVHAAYEYDVERIINGGAVNDSSSEQVKANRWDAKYSEKGWSYQVRIRSSAGNRKGDWSNWLTAIAKPESAAPPADVTVHSTPSGFDITWTAPSGKYSDSIIQYDIYWQDQDLQCAYPQNAGFEPTGTAHIVNLTAGHRHSVSIDAWNAAGPGLPFLARDIVPGSGVPGTTTGLQVGVTNDTHFHLTWDAMRGAAGYYVLSRSISQSETRWEKVDGTFSRPCADVLAPTNGTYEYAITAFNGDTDGGRSQAVEAPKAGSPSVGACPAPPDPCPPTDPSTIPGTDPIDPSDPPPVNSTKTDS
ncbi:unnamed protein product [Zymoseptoria tritici ST99CH_1A5]|uniref:Fibronectin type-III domain-containing protein n=1 Tax=Zymoseptoria tritici ST99CH_1A5 TaxID=1276529 RepID=A0A1Y6LZZ8_ZYMTR|nr:unnamed protein product [Zymoseptoria tritici ST99CH_1A5]